MEAPSTQALLDIMHGAGEEMSHGALRRMSDINMAMVWTDGPPAENGSYEQSHRKGQDRPDSEVLLQRYMGQSSYIAFSPELVLQKIVKMPRSPPLRDL
eukprot:1883938-Rhodomonas_salina.1